MSKYASGTPSVKEIKNADFFESLSVGEVNKVSKKAKTNKKSRSK